MADANSTGVEVSIRSIPGIKFLGQHPKAKQAAEQGRLPAAGRLKWIGHNFGMDTPIGSEVVDHNGNWYDFDLSALLLRLNDFEGSMFGEGFLSVQDNILAYAFGAYEHNMMTDDERATFEAFVREKVDGISVVGAAKSLLVRGHQ